MFKDRNVEIFEKANKINYLGNSLPTIVRIKPTNRQLRNYFLNMFCLNIHHSDSKVKNIENNVHKFVKSIFGRYFNNMSMTKYEEYSYQLLAILERLKISKIKKLLETHNMMPMYLYGIQKNNKNYFAFDGYTDIEFASFDRDMFLFKCFNSNISLMANSRYLESSLPSIETYLSNNGTLIYRELNEPYFVELHEDYSNIQFKRILPINKADEIVGLNSIKKHPLSESFQVLELDQSCEIEDEDYIFTFLKM